MTSFLSRLGSLIEYAVSGFDRQRFAGASRRLNNERGVDSSIGQQNLRHADFPRHAEALTLALRQQTEQDARAAGVPLVPLNHAQVDQEARALELAQAHGRHSGRIAVLSAVELCDTYRVREGPPASERGRNARTGPAAGARADHEGTRHAPLSPQRRRPPHRRRPALRTRQRRTPFGRQRLKITLAREEITGYQ